MKRFYSCPNLFIYFLFYFEGLSRNYIDFNIVTTTSGSILSVTSLNLSFGGISRGFGAFHEDIPGKYLKDITQWRFKKNG